MKQLIIRSNYKFLHFHILTFSAYVEGQQDEAEEEEVAEMLATHIQTLQREKRAIESRYTR